MDFVANLALGFSVALTPFNLLTPTSWTGEEANKYLDSITSNYESALAALGGLKK